MADADRDLLFGTLALHSGLIDRDPLVAANRARAGDRTLSMADRLSVRGDLDGDGRAAVERSLATLADGGSIGETLARPGDADAGLTLGPSASGARGSATGRPSRGRTHPG